VSRDAVIEALWGGAAPLTARSQIRAAAVVADLAPEVEAHPLRERLRARLMTALCHSGRRAEALQNHRAYRARLAEDQGLDPGREIVELERAILRDLAPRACSTREAESVAERLAALDLLGDRPHRAVPPHLIPPHLVPPHVVPPHEGAARGRP